MKKLLLLALSISISTTYAAIPYCPGTRVTGYKNQALQYVVATFAKNSHCVVGNNCLQNFDQVKYSIAWKELCSESAAKGNDPNGSTFICQDGQCHPLGFAEPLGLYEN